MNFTPENLIKVLDGTKTQTRRFTEYKSDVLAVCPGRGKKAVGYVRVIRKWQEPLQDIIAGDCVAELGWGEPCLDCDALISLHWDESYSEHWWVGNDTDGYEAKELGEALYAFRDLWDSLYGGVAGKQWADNPLVWAYEFELLPPRPENIGPTQER